jgi:ankyrin
MNISQTINLVAAAIIINSSLMGMEYNFDLKYANYETDIENAIKEHSINKLWDLRHRKDYALNTNPHYVNNSSETEARINYNKNIKSTRYEDKKVFYAPIHFAAQYDSPEIIDWLGQTTCSPYSYPEPLTWRTPLHVAVNHNSLKAIAALVTRYKVDLDAKDENGDTPLALARKLQRNEAIALLTGDTQINTMHPLLKAVDASEAEVENAIKEKSVEKLYNLYAYKNYPLNMNPHYMYNFPETEARISYNKNVRSTRYEDKKVFYAPMHLAAQYNSPEIIKLIAQISSSYSKPEPLTQRTPLHVAVNHNSLEVIKILVTRYKVDLDAKDENGDTPLSLAQKLNRTEAIALLTNKK